MEGFFGGWWAGGCGGVWERGVCVRVNSALVMIERSGLFSSIINTF